MGELEAERWWGGLHIQRQEETGLLEGRASRKKSKCVFLQKKIKSHLVTHLTCSRFLKGENDRKVRLVLVK